MNNFSFLLIRLAIIAIIICALYVNVFLLYECVVFPESIIENISGYLNRFVTLRDVLPRHGAVGYIDGLDDDELSTPGKKYSLDEELPTQRIYLAQYALSPVILVRSLDYQLVVGNFINPPPDLEMYRKMGLVPLRDFGNGIIMFKRELR